MYYGSVYGGPVSPEQIQVANPDIESLDVGTSLVIPLPCDCFNGTEREETDRDAELPRRSSDR